MSMKSQRYPPSPPYQPSPSGYHDRQAESKSKPLRGQVPQQTNESTTDIANNWSLLLIIFLTISSLITFLSTMNIVPIYYHLDMQHLVSYNLITMIVSLIVLIHLSIGWYGYFRDNKNAYRWVSDTTDG